MDNIFEYTNPTVPEDCKFIISPSQIYKFFECPKVWYLENIKKEPSEFKGNTSTVMGTICHYIYEQIAKGNMNINREEINAQLEDYLNEHPEIPADRSAIQINYPLVAMEVVNKYVIPHKTGGILRMEDKVSAKLTDGIYLAGTCDRLEGDTIVDYKNVSVKPNENEIPFHYKIQLLAYAYIYRKMGYVINNIRIVYGVKPTKTIPARCIVVTEVIDYPMEKMMTDTLNLIAETIKHHEEKPEDDYLIFKSMELKNA